MAAETRAGEVYLASIPSLPAGTTVVTPVAMSRSTAASKAQEGPDDILKHTTAGTGPPPASRRRRAWSRETHSTPAATTASSMEPWSGITLTATILAFLATPLHQSQRRIRKKPPYALGTRGDNPSEVGSMTVQVPGLNSDWLIVWRGGGGRSLTGKPAIVHRGPSTLEMTC